MTSSSVSYPFLGCLAFCAMALLASCGDDRSGEQPFAPTVVSRGCEVVADSVVMTGEVTASPNSSLTRCGFVVGNDTLRREVDAREVAWAFTAVADSLEAGDYYAVSFATNGMGTSYGDTLRFTMK